MYIYIYNIYICVYVYMYVHVYIYKCTPFFADGPNFDAGQDKLLRAQSGGVPKGGRYGRHHDGRGARVHTGR